MTTEDFFSRCREYFSARGTAIEEGRELPGCRLRPALYAMETGRSLGIFFPFEDHFFFHDLNDPAVNTPDTLRELHESARAMVNARFRLPRAMRYKVPNIVTVAVSERSFPPETAAFAMKKTVDIIGGERHSVFLVDLLQQKIVSQGLEVHYAEFLTLQFNRVSPINRAFHAVHAMAAGNETPRKRG